LRRQEGANLANLQKINGGLGWKTVWSRGRGKGVKGGGKEEMLTLRSPRSRKKRVQGKTNQKGGGMPRMGKRGVSPNRCQPKKGSKKETTFGEKGY